MIADAPQVRGCRPGRPTLTLMTISAVRQQLPDHDEDDILRLIEGGELEYAWNIGMSGHRLEPRIFPKCVFHYLATRGREPFKQSESEVLRELLSAVGADGQPGIKANTLRLLFCCSVGLIHDLLRNRTLEQVAGSAWGRGPYGSPLISVASFERFLGERRMV